MDHPFVRKLRHGASLTLEDERLLAELGRSVRRIPGRTDIVAEGEQPRSVVLVVEGWACRYRQLENGKRQIISLFVPGDLCEPFGVLPHFIESSVAALTAVGFAPVSLQAICRVAKQSPRIEEALWWDLLVASAVEREHVVSLGRRSASERLGHLFCELHLRLSMVGLVDNLGFELPVTQTDLGDLLGLSTVHVNRSLQELRRAGLISQRGRRLVINELQDLREFSFFEPLYLQLKGSVTC